MGYRPCRLCRAFHFIEETGKVATNGEGEPTPRMGPVPCETSLGCEKGHWREEVILSPAQEALVEAFWASRAGAGLSEAARRSPYVRKLFATLQRLVEERNQRQLLDTILLAVLRKK